MNAIDIKRIYKIFSKAPRPYGNEITLYRNEECNEIRDDFSPHSVEKIPDEVLYHHFDCLTYLSPKALRYYLPRFLEYSYKFENSSTAEFLNNYLCPQQIFDDYWEKRIDVFTNEEKRVVVHYLEFLLSKNCSQLENDFLTIGIQLWQYA